MHWLLKSPVHQQAWYWLCQTNNMYYCSRVNFICLDQAILKILFKMGIYLLWFLKQFNMLRVDKRLTYEKKSYLLFMRLVKIFFIPTAPAVSEKIHLLTDLFCCKSSYHFLGLWSISTLMLSFFFKASDILLVHHIMLLLFCLYLFRLLLGHITLVGITGTAVLVSYL